MFLSDILDTINFNDKAELDEAGDVFLETGSVGGLLVYDGGQFPFQIFICEHS